MQLATLSPSLRYKMRLIGLKLIHLSPMDFLHMVVTLNCQHTVRDCKILACFLAVPTACIHAPGSTSIRYTSTSLESSYGKQVHTLYCPAISLVGTSSAGVTRQQSTLGGCISS